MPNLYYPEDHGLKVQSYFQNQKMKQRQWRREYIRHRRYHSLRLNLTCLSNRTLTRNYPTRRNRETEGLTYRLLRISAVHQRTPQTC